MQSILDAGLSLGSDATFSVLSREGNRAETVNPSRGPWKGAERVNGRKVGYRAKRPENSHNYGKLLLGASAPARTQPTSAKKRFVCKNGHLKAINPIACAGSPCFGGRPLVRASRS
jgi:hypothetical protein